MNKVFWTSLREVLNYLFTPDSDLILFLGTCDLYRGKPPRTSPCCQSAQKRRVRILYVIRKGISSSSNYRATGVTTAMVERMEENFKKDVLRELRANEGRVLLHDEVEERPGSFAIVPLWETVSEADILTPRDVFGLMKKEGFKVGSRLD